MVLVICMNFNNYVCFIVWLIDVGEKVIMDIVFGGDIFDLNVDYFLVLKFLLILGRDEMNVFEELMEELFWDIFCWDLGNCNF